MHIAVGCCRCWCSQTNLWSSAHSGHKAFVEFSFFKGLCKQANEQTREYMEITLNNDNFFTWIVHISIAILFSPHFPNRNLEKCLPITFVSTPIYDNILPDYAICFVYFCPAIADDVIMCLVYQVILQKHCWLSIYPGHHSFLTFNHFGRRQSFDIREEKSSKKWWCSSNCTLFFLSLSHLLFVAFQFQRFCSNIFHLEKYFPITLCVNFIWHLNECKLKCNYKISL